MDSDQLIVKWAVSLYMQTEKQIQCYTIEYNSIHVIFSAHVA